MYVTQVKKLLFVLCLLLNPTKVVPSFESHEKVPSFESHEKVPSLGDVELFLDLLCAQCS